MKPYYEDTKSGIVIYHGDCREILPELGAESIDLVLTDPQYGIGADNNFGRGNTQRGASAALSKDYGDASWDSSPPDAELLGMVLAAGKRSILWGGNYFALPPAPGWLVWDKDNGDNGYADCELAWTNLRQAVRKIRFRWNGMLQEYGGKDKEHRWHPTQKPLPVMAWCIRQALKHNNVSTILDPFMGSGTTLIAARDLGRRAVGIELKEKYCEIAAKRLGQEVFDW